MTDILCITEEEYRDLCESHSGFCDKCGKVNEGFHEPDAENYTCDNCGKQSSHGIEQCLVIGLIEIVDEEQSDLETRY